MKLLPYYERPKSSLLAAMIAANITSKNPNWGSRMVSRRSRSGYMYDVMPPLAMEDALPEELR